MRGGEQVVTYPSRGALGRTRLAAGVLLALLASPLAASDRTSLAPEPPGPPDRIQALVDEISASIEKIRRLKFKTPVKAQSISASATL